MARSYDPDGLTDDFGDGPPRDDPPEPRNDPRGVVPPNPLAPLAWIVLGTLTVAGFVWTVARVLNAPN